MLRTIGLSVVLALAVGQDALLLCKVWCDPNEAAATGCHAAESTEHPRVTGNNPCDEDKPGSVAALGEEVRRSVSDSQTDHAAVIPGDRAARSTGEGWFEQQSEHLQAIENRPLVTALRI